MAPEAAQSYANHRKFVPLFHFVTLGLLALNLLWAGYRLYRAIRWSHGRFDVVDNIVALLLAVALLLLANFSRAFPLAAQDRIIRLEMRTRLAEVLPKELRPRIDELSRGQLIALRFASDEELPALTRKVLEERITDREAIKKLIRTWQPDRMRM